MYKLFPNVSFEYFNNKNHVIKENSCLKNKNKVRNKDYLVEEI